MFFSKVNISFSLDSLVLKKKVCIKNLEVLSSCLCNLHLTKLIGNFIMPDKGDKKLDGNQNNISLFYFETLLWFFLCFWNKSVFLNTTSYKQYNSIDTIYYTTGMKYNSYMYFINYTILWFYYKLVRDLNIQINSSKPLLYSYNKKSDLFDNSLKRELMSSFSVGFILNYSLINNLCKRYSCKAYFSSWGNRYQFTYQFLPRYFDSLFITVVYVSFSYKYYTRALKSLGFYLYIYWYYWLIYEDTL